MKKLFRTPITWLVALTLSLGLIGCGEPPEEIHLYQSELKVKKGNTFKPYPHDHTGISGGSSKTNAIDTVQKMRSEGKKGTFLIITRGTAGFAGAVKHIFIVHNKESEATFYKYLHVGGEPFKSTSRWDIREDVKYAVVAMISRMRKIEKFTADMEKVEVKK